MDMTAFSNRLKELRTARGLSQEQLAERIDVSRQVITKWENGSGTPKIENLLALAKYFGISVDSLLGREDADFGEAGNIPEDLRALMLRLEKELKAGRTARNDPFRRLIGAAAQYFDIERTELLLSPGRNRIVRAQLELIFILGETGCSAREISDILGCRHADLIPIYLAQAKEEYRRDPEFQKDILHIRAMADDSRR